MLVNRHIINSDINYDGMNRDDLFKLINRWKHLLLRYKVKQGDVMALGIFDVNHNHIACLFAAAELGLKIFIISKPIARETIHATKMGIFGPVDITISQSFIDPSDVHIEMFEKYSKVICYEDEIDTVSDDTDIACNSISPSTPLIFASTSGTTSASKPVVFTHEEVYKISQRNIEVFGFNKQSVIQQTMNMHHASAMLTYLFPTLIACDTHYVGAPAWGKHLMKEIILPESFVEFCLLERRVDNIICSNVFMLHLLMRAFDSAKKWPKYRIRLNMSGFPANELIYDIAKKYPIDVISHYGSIDTGIPLLVNIITENSVHIQDFLGNQMDDFYRIQDGLVYCDMWKEARELPDNLLKTDNGYYFVGRTNEEELGSELKEALANQIDDYSLVDGTLVIWDKVIVIEKFFYNLFKNIVFLNKMDFMVDTKVSMEQLRAYLEHHYAV